MRTVQILFASCLLFALQAFLPVLAMAETDVPDAKPKMTVTNPAGEEDSSGAYDGEAPAKAVFEANSENLGAFTARYEWIFVDVALQDTFLVRYDENTEYEFSTSGSFTVTLKATFTQGSMVYDYEYDPFTITISESKLTVPNAFTPNGDGINDVFRVKEDYQSIISFSATIFNRWGKKLYSWSDLEGGWDGTSNGKEVPDGAYYLLLKARGADGRNYDMKKTINLLRGYTEGGTGSSP